MSGTIRKMWGSKRNVGERTIGVLLCTWPNERIYKVWYDIGE